MNKRKYTITVPEELDAELTDLMQRLQAAPDDVVRMAISLLLLADRGELRLNDGTLRRVTLARIRGCNT